MIGRCKFLLQVTETLDWGRGSTQKKFKFNTVYDKTIPEDVEFCKATPSGSMEVVIDNPNVTDKLIPGKSYYIDIVEIPEP